MSNTDARLARGTRLSADWMPTQEHIDYARSLGLTLQQIERIGLDFAAYWSEIPGQRGLKIRWTGTWQVWVRREADKRGLSRSMPSRLTAIDVASDLADSLGFEAR